MRLPAKAYHFGTNEGAPGPPSRAPPPAAWARAQRERDKRGLALAPRVHAIIRLPPKAYHLATNEGAPGPPPRAPPPAAWQRERDKRGLALWATLARGLQPRADAFLPCGLPSRAGYSHPRADAFSPCGLPSCVGCTTRRCFLAWWATVTRGLRSHPRGMLSCRVGYPHAWATLTHAPMPSCPVGYPHAWAAPTRRIFVALWATVTRGLRSHPRAAAFWPCGLPSCVGHALCQNPP